jgi:hypothetical protein
VTFFPIANTCAQNLQIVASYVIPIVATIGAIVAYRAIHAQREINARRIYFDYLKLAFENPKFAYPQSSPKPFDHENETVGGCKVEYEKYEWFLSMLLASIEGILEITGRRSVWRKTALLQLEYHREYLSRHNTKSWIPTMSRTFSRVTKMLKVSAHA